MNISIPLSAVLYNGRFDPFKVQILAFLSVAMRHQISMRSGNKVH